MIDRELILTNVAGKPDTKRFRTREEMKAIREGLEKATEEDFRRFDEAKRKAIERGSRYILD